jgi:hypothetical protein
MRPGREADHSPPYNAEIKNEWSYTSTPTTPSWRVAQLKHRDNFTFAFYLFYHIKGKIVSVSKHRSMKDVGAEVILELHGAVWSPLLSDCLTPSTD